jgi:hypothetical protein
MSEQNYVYTTHQLSNPESAMENMESILNEYARQGWRLSDTVDRNGTTTGLVFERAVRE